MKKFIAFTMAEVLMTTAIVGVLASMTIPSLVDNQQKKVAAVRLSKFYSLMNQALDKYYTDKNMVPTDLHVTGTFKYWFTGGILKNLRTASTSGSDDTVEVLMEDGTKFFANYSSSNGKIDIKFCVDANKCSQTLDTKNVFAFSIENGTFYASDSSVQNNNRKTLLNGCVPGVAMKSCTKLIQLDGWKISSDYPWNKKK